MMGGPAIVDAAQDAKAAIHAATARLEAAIHELTTVVGSRREPARAGPW